MRSTLAITALALALNIVHASDRGRLALPKAAVLPPPVDVALPADLQRFLTGLREAAANRDADFLARHAAPDIETSFGPDPLTLRKLFQDEGGAAWVALEQMLALGGAFLRGGQDGIYCLPYYFATFPDDLDPHEHAVVVRAGTDARCDPDDAGTAVPLPHYALLRYRWGVEGGIRIVEGTRWVPVAMNGKAMYAPDAAMRSPVDRRLCASRRNGRWRITAYIGGD